MKTNNVWKKVLAVACSGAMMLSMSGCDVISDIWSDIQKALGNDTSESTDTGSTVSPSDSSGSGSSDTPVTDATLEGVSWTQIVGNYDAGAMVDGIILELPASAAMTADEVAALSVDDFEMYREDADGTTYKTRVITEILPSDASGADLTDTLGSATTQYVRFNFLCGYSYFDWTEGFFTIMYGASPFTTLYTEDGTSYTGYNPDYAMHIGLADGATLEIGDATYSAIEVEGVYAHRVTTMDDWITGTYTFDPTQYDESELHNANKTDSVALNYGLWQPDGAASSTDDYPLFVWLHGAGEGGYEIANCVLGNNLVNLTESDSDGVQQYFSNGAYILAVQSPTYWMATEDGTTLSIYTDAVKATIDEMIANYNIDPDRVYVGGDSNGGYMTLNMVIEYPGFFAAALPTCSTYWFNGYTEEEVQATMEQLCNENIWFVHSADDSTVLPYSTTGGAGLFVTLSQMHAADTEGKYTGSVYMTFSDEVKVEDDNVLDPSGSTTTQYYGHWSWVYTLRGDSCGLVLDYTKMADYIGHISYSWTSYAFECDDDTLTWPVTGWSDMVVLYDGTTVAASEAAEGTYYTDMWEWVAAQSK